MATNLNEQVTQDSWWRDWFNQIYLDVYAHRNDESADQEIAAVQQFLPVSPEDCLLDLCCGSGRHCRAFRRAGFKKIIGLDYSHALLRQAKIEPPPVRYIRGDMRFLPFQDHCFDVLLSFFTSFGYFKTNVENINVLHEMARVIRPQGSFMIDYLNAEYIKKTLEPISERVQGDYTIKEMRSISEDGERVEKTIVIENWGGKEHRYYESVRLYTFEQMTDMLESADLEIQKVYGSFEGDDFHYNSPCMILCGKKIT